MPDAVVGTTSYISSNDLGVFDNMYKQAGPNRVNTALTWAFGQVNEVLVLKVPVPLKKTSTGEYDSSVKTWQALLALDYIYRGNAPEKADSYMLAVTNPDGTGILDRYLKGEWVPEVMTTVAEVGFQQAVAGSSNSGSGKLVIDVRAKYDDDRDRTWTFIVTTAGAVGTMVFKWKSDLDSSTYTENVLSSSDWLYFEWGLKGYCVGDAAGDFVVNDSFTVKGIPQQADLQGMGPSTAGLLR